MNAKLLLLIASALLLLPIQAFAGSRGWESSFDYFVSNDDLFGAKDVEPTIAVQTNNPNNVVAGHYTFANDNCQIYRSTNGGTGWSKVADFSKHGSFDRLYDPVVTSANNGNFYFVCVGQTSADVYYMRLATSTNGGASGSWNWSDAIAETIVELDKPWIAADAWSTSSYVNNVYLCWTEFPSVQVKVKRIVPLDSDESAVTLGTGLGCYITVGPSGQVYVAYMTEFGSNNGGQIKMHRNLSGGNPSSWSGAYIIGSYSSIPASENCVYDGRTFECVDSFNGINYRVNHLPSIATDSKGGVHAAWFTYSSSTLSNVVYSNSNSCKSSSDSCTGWNPPVKINLDTGARDQFNPSLVVSQGSNVIHVTAYDKRDDSSNRFYRVYDYHCHYDLPVTDCRSASHWSNTQITSTATANLDQVAFIDDYHGIATSVSREAYTDWTDHRETSANDYDIWANRSSKGFEIIATEMSTGNPITGLNVIVFNPSGVQVANGFTPFTYTPTTTGTYTVKFNNYGSYFVTRTPSTPYTTDYKIYNWGMVVNVNVSSTNNQYAINGICYNSNLAGGYAMLGIETQTLGGGQLSMFSSIKHPDGTILTQGYAPYVIGLPIITELTVTWNDYQTHDYQYADPGPSSIEVPGSDIAYDWGGVQKIILPSSGGVYSDIGKYD